MQTTSILKALTLSLTLLAASNSFAGAADLLSQDLQKGMKSLPRETRLYTYFGSGSTQGVLNNGKSFWDLNNHSTKLSNAGLGVYMAVDPYVSSPDNGADTGMPGGYGSSMLEVTFNSGTRYLDLVKAIKLSPATLAAIRAETGMTATDEKQLFEAEEKGFWRDTLRYMVEDKPAHKLVRNIVNEVFKRNSITLTEYRWYSSVSGFCSVTSGKEQKMFSALVFIGKDNSSIKKAISFSTNGSQLRSGESQADVRVNKLRDVLRELKPMEKSYMAGNQTAALSKMKSKVFEKYPNAAEVNDIRSATLDCVK